MTLSQSYLNKFFTDYKINVLIIAIWETPNSWANSSHLAPSHPEVTSINVQYIFCVFRIPRIAGSRGGPEGSTCSEGPL